MMSPATLSEVASRRSDTCMHPVRVQPDAAVLVAGAGSLLIERVAGPAMRLVGQPMQALTGQPLEDVFGSAAESWLACARAEMSRVFAGQWQSASAVCDVTVRRCDEHIVLEFELAATGSSSTAMARLSRALEALEASPDPASLRATAVREIRRLTGFDRVLLARCPAGNTATVLAEDKLDELPSLLGAAPVPWVWPWPTHALSDQVESTTDLSPAPVVPWLSAAGGQHPVPPGTCVLCGELAGVSDPGAFGAMACLAIPVAGEDTPHVFIGHHRQARHVGYDVREACRLLARTFATQRRSWQQRAQGRRADDIAVARKRALERMRRALTEQRALVARKDLLMQEVHHRTQNGLQIVNAMLQLQARKAPDPAVRAQFDDAVGRLMAVSSVHRHLWRSGDMQNVRLDGYLEQLCGDLTRSWGAPWANRLSLSAVAVTVAGNTAATLGLIVTELLTNTVKYAYGGDPGPIRLRVRRTSPRTLQVTVSDRGCGIGEAKSSGLGSELIRIFTQQLGGTTRTVSGAGGTAVTLRIPLPLINEAGAEPLEHAVTAAANDA